MPRNASGVYTLPAGNPVVPGTTIDAAWANDTLEDLANEVTNSLSRTGAGGMLAPFRLADGTVTAPGIAWLNETNSGLYRSGAGSTWMSILGVNTAQFSTVGLTIPFGKALTAQGNASVAGTFAVGGHTTLASTLAVTGALTASGGVTGNVTGNVTAGSGTSTFNDVVITGALDMTAGSSATITGLSTPTNASDAANKGYVDAQVATRLAIAGGSMWGPIEMQNFKVTGVATPTADQDAANKAYVDNVAQGLDAKASCVLATTTNITLSGVQTVDGFTADTNDRILVKNQTNAAENGIYAANPAGAWTRTADANTWQELVAAFTFVERGNTNANNGYVCTIPASGTLGVTAVTWAQFSGAGQIDAGTGMSKTGNTLNVNTASSARIVVGADNIDLATTGVTGGTYRSVTVDAYGRVTAGTNPTTIAGYGITDAYTTTQVDTALALKLNLTGGTMSGVIAMGANKITGLADPTNPQDAATKTYIDTIFGSTTTAAASAAAAASSASSAAASATNAANSATAAAGSATSAASSYTTFNNQYLGSKASDPTVNNTGGALVEGNLYWNSTSNEMRVYDGAAWLAAYLPATGYLPLSGGTLTGNLAFSGTGLTIRGDFSNATASSRLAFQSSTTNGATVVAAKPNGTGTASYLQAFNASDADNAAYGYLGVTGSAVVVNSNVTGTGTLLPLVLSVGVERARVSTAGNMLIGGTTDNGTDKLQVTGSMSLSSALRVGASPSAGTSGQVLTSAGAGAAPTWTTLASSQWTTSGSNISYTAGQVQIGTGSAAAPALSVASDTNTGIFFPAADTIAFAEGGAEVARFDSAGNLGIGTTSPGVRLDVRGSSPTLQVGQDGSSNGVSLAWSNADGSARINTTGAAWPIIFQQNATERFRFGPAGQFGIGGANYGTSGQVLTSQGSGAAPVWASASSGMTLVSTTTPSGGPTTIDINFSASFSDYIIVIDNIQPATSGAPSLFMRVLVGGVVQSGGSDYARQSSSNAVNETAFSTSDFTAISAGTLNVAFGSANRGVNAFMNLHNANAAGPKTWYVNSVQTNSSNQFTAMLSTGAYTGTSALSGFRLYWSNNNTFANQGTIKVYGLSN